MFLTLTGLAFGLVQGARHALEPDHLAAVSTLVADGRANRARWWLGAAWGVGHTLTLFVAGGALILLRAEMPAALGDTFELGVAVMLIALGGRALARAFREGRTGPATVHAHGGESHAHAHAAPHVHVHEWSFALRPLAIGLVHGLAGSGALTAFVMAKIASGADARGAAAALVFLALFGAGSVLGMSALTGVLGWPLARWTRRPVGAKVTLAAAGALSLVMGIAWGAPIVARFFG
jgi:High-affinity nickel-transport protein